MDNEEQKPVTTEPKVDSTSEELTRLYANESETQVTPTEPALTSSTPVSPLQMPKQKSGKGKKVALTLLILLVVAGLGGVAYWQYSEAQDAKSQASANQTALEQKASELSTLKNQYDTLKVDDTPKADPIVSGLGIKQSEVDAIKSSVIAYSRTPKGNEKIDYVANVVKVSGDFAYTLLSSKSQPQGGSGCIVKKVDSIWVTLFCSQDVLPQSEIDKYGIPTGLTS